MINIKSCLLVLILVTVVDSLYERRSHLKPAFRHLKGSEDQNLDERSLNRLRQHADAQQRRKHLKPNQRYFERLMQQDDDERAFIRYFQARDASNSTTVATTVATTVNTTASSTVANTTTNVTATTAASNTTSNTSIVITLQNRAAMDARLQVLYTNANCEPFLAQSSTLLTSETTSVTLPTGSLNVKVIVQKDLIASNWRDAYTTKLNTTTLCLRITGVTVASNVEACPT